MPRGEIEDKTALRELVVRRPRRQGYRGFFKPRVEVRPEEAHLPLDSGFRVDVRHCAHAALIGLAHSQILLSPRPTALAPH
jgi:hypothetical protein